MEKILYDADPCGAGAPCPKFVLSADKKEVTLIDKKGRKASMSIEHFNKFIDAAKSGELKKI